MERDVPYPADYDEAMRGFMGARLLEGTHDVWSAARQSLIDRGLDPESIDAAERDLITARGRSELFLARLVTVGGLTPEEVVDRGADLATVARVVGESVAQERPDVTDGTSGIELR